MLTSVFHLPSPAALRAAAMRGAALWLGLRLAVELAVRLAGIPPSTPATDAFLAVVAASLVWLDGRRFHEHFFQANLGVRSGWFVLAALVGAATLALASNLAGHLL